MQLIIKKEKLLEILKENKKNHRAIFEKAVEGFRKQSIEALEKKIEKIKKGKLENIMVNFPVPEDHTIDYDRVIRMVELTEEQELKLDEDESAMYIMDDWAWKRQWTASNSMYTQMVK
jgi:hypothetical protein